MANGGASTVTQASREGEINSNSVHKASKSKTEASSRPSTPNDRTTKTKPFTPYSELESSCGGNLGHGLTGFKENKTTEAFDAKSCVNDQKVNKNKKRIFGKQRQNNGSKLAENLMKQTF